MRVEGRIPFLGVALIMAFIASLLATRAAACPLELPTTTISVNGHHLVVELATTPRERSCGLSHRSHLEADQGMLFVYPSSGPRSFWMKATHIPLAIAFLDASGGIINIETMAPDQTEARYRSQLPALYALEVNQGWFRLHDVKPGDRVDVNLPGNGDGLPPDPFTPPRNPPPSPPASPRQ